MKTAANIGEFVNLYLKHQQQKIEMQTNKLGFNPIPDGGEGDDYTSCLENSL